MDLFSILLFGDASIYAIIIAIELYVSNRFCTSIHGFLRVLLSIINVYQAVALLALNVQGNGLFIYKKSYIGFLFYTETYWRQMDNSYHTHNLKERNESKKIMHFMKLTYFKKYGFLEILFYDGNQIDDKIVCGLGEGFLCIHSSFVC